MKFAYNHLLDWIDTPLTARQTGDLLTMAGFELESIDEARADRDSILDVSVMSNRGDGLSIYGLAREVLAKSTASKPTTNYYAANQGFAGSDAIWTLAADDRVSIETEDCTRYACATFAAAMSPSAYPSLQARLVAAGIRPIGPIVDTTNFVMLELGQPLHAFDFDKLRGGRIVVRRARKGERLTTLDGVEHELNPGQMMICDAERPIAAAGIMGGLETEVTAETKTILLESAHFSNVSVRRTRKELGLSTEASYRFERSVDPDGVVRAIRRFGELLSHSPLDFVDNYPSPPKLASIPLSIERAERLLGMPVEKSEAEGYLNRLGFDVEKEGDGKYRVTAPSWRPDVVREEDLVEEIGRVHGYDHIPDDSLPKGTTTLGGAHEDTLRNDRIRQTLLRLGYSQTVSHSLRDAHALDASGPRVGPRNPGSPELALLRNSMLPSLAEAARRNGAKDLHLFEMGEVFVPNAGRTRQIGILSMGALYPPARANDPVVEADFFSLKGAVCELCDRLGLSPDFASFEGDPRFHSGRCAKVKLGKTDVGVVGAIHPSIAAEIGLPEDSVMAELAVEPMLKTATDEFEIRAISRNPAVRRDISVQIAKSVAYGDLDKAIVKAGGKDLESSWLFDVYSGTGITEGSHSLSFAIQLRKMGGNFTDEEANQVRDRIVRELESLGATLR